MIARRESRSEGLAALCQSCGLCCDGSLFGRVRLAAVEVESARRLRLPVVANGGSLALPCTALVTESATRRCDVYAARPEACRQFACTLYTRHEQHGTQLDASLALVQRAKTLLASLGQPGTAPGPELFELTAILERHFARASTEPPSRATACPGSRRRVPADRRGVERRDAGSEAPFERIERGRGRPLAPRLGPLGEGGNRRGSAKHRRSVSLHA